MSSLYLSSFTLIDNVVSLLTKMHNMILCMCLMVYGGGVGGGDCVNGFVFYKCTNYNININLQYSHDLGITLLLTHIKHGLLVHHSQFS